MSNKRLQLPHDHGSHEHLADTLKILNDPESFRRIADLFKRLGDTTRLRIFWFLCHYEECVLNIAAALEMSSPAISHHLKRLKEDGLIESRREGKEVYYHVSDHAQSELLHQMIELIMKVSCPELQQLPKHLDHTCLSCERAGAKTVALKDRSDPEKDPKKGLENDRKTASDYHQQQLEIIHQIHEYLTLHMDQHCTVESLARQFLMNPTTLKTLFKAEYGNSIAAHIREHRMERAAELLEQGSLSLGEIAGMVGYQSQSKFTAAFKEYYGMLPREYRKSFANAQEQIDKKLCTS